MTKYYCPECQTTNMPYGSGLCPCKEDANGNLYIHLVEMPNTFKIVDSELYKEHTEPVEWKIPRTDRENELLDCLTGLYYGLAGYQEKSLRLLKDYKCNVEVIDNRNA